MYDTTKVLYYKEIAINERLKASRDFWRETSLYLGVGISALLIYRLLVEKTAQTAAYICDFSAVQ